MGISDWFKSKKRKEAEARSSIESARSSAEKLGFDKPKETVLTKIVRAPSPTTTTTSTRRRSSSSRQRMSIAPEKITSTEKLGITAPAENVLTRASKLKPREDTGQPIRFDPVTKKPIIEVDGGRSKFTGEESIVRPSEEVSSRTQFQKEFLEQSSITPRFGTIGFGQGGMVSFGEIQRERELKGMESIPGYYDEPDVKTQTKKVLSQIPIIGSAIDFGEKAGEFIESESRWKSVGKTAKKEKGERTTEEALEYYGTVYEGRDTRSQKALSAMLSGGILAAEVVPLASYGARVGKTTLEKSLAKQISIGAEQLGKAPVISGSVVDIGSGKFAQQFKQTAGSFERRGLLFGQAKEGGSGVQFIPSGKGLAIAGGRAELTGAKKISAKLLGSDTKKVFAQAQTFDIGSAQIGSTGGKAFGFKTSVALGEGVFAPIKTVTGIGGRSGAMIETRVGDTAISTGFRTPSFTKQFPKGSISYFETRGGKGIQLATDLTKPKTSVIGIAKPTKTGRTGTKFLDGIKSTEVKITKIAPEVKAPVTRNGLILETKAPVTQKIKTPQVSETLQRGFSRTVYKPKPFQFVKPKIPKGVIGVSTISIGARAFISGKLKVPTFGQDFRTGQITDTGFVSGTSFGFDTGQITDTGFKPISPTITTPGTGGFVPKTPTPIIPGLILPSLTIGKAKGVGRISGRFVPDYSQSFAGWSIGAIGKTKGLRIGGREVYTGLEIRGKQKKKSKKKK